MQNAPFDSTQGREFRSRKIFIIAFAVIFFDQLTKHLVRKQAIIKFAIIENPGLPFNLNLPGFFNLAGVGVLVMLFVWLYFRYFKTRVSEWGLALILGGAASNILDRIEKGTVTDFLNLGISTLNLADIAIMIGIAALMLNAKFKSQSAK